MSGADTVLQLSRARNDSGTSMTRSAVLIPVRSRVHERPRKGVPGPGPERSGQRSDLDVHGCGRLVEGGAVVVGEELGDQLAAAADAYLGKDRLQVVANRV